jgi:hypothetical protein
VASKSGVVEFWRHRPQAGNDIPKRLSEGQLCKGHAEELIETRKFPYAAVAAVTTHTLIELVFWNEVRQLRKNGTLGIHRPALYWRKCTEFGCCL